MVHGGKVSLLAGFVCFGLGLGSKETAIMVPVVLLAYDGLILGAQRPADSARRVSWGLHASLLALLLVAAAARSILFVFVEQHANAGFNWRHVLVDVDVLAQYVSLIVLPLKQSFVHAVTPTASAFLRGLAIVGIVAAIAIRVRRSQPLVSFGLVWSVAWLLPGLGLILLANVGVPMAERRAYLSVFGLVLAVVVALDDWWQQSRLQQKTRLATAYVALTIVIVGLAGLTAQRLRLWADPVLLWSDAVVKAPGTWMAQFGLADAYQTVGDCEAALAPYTRAITLVPQNAQAYDGLAGCLTELHRSDEARDVLRTAVQRIPDAAQARVTLAGLEAAANHRAEAVRLCAEVQALAPGTREAATCVWR
jgi:Tfp pilus assembly protein PilF